MNGDKPQSSRCEKRRYDALGAMLALTKIRGRRKGTYTEKRKYWCEQCKAYHLTSQP